jgi:ribose/xylose/arabinose/galactoside ABC-type transport system permease subunit
MKHRFTTFAPPGTLDVALRVVLAVAVYIVFATTVPGFATSSNMYAVLEACVPIGLVALGVGATIIAGELDLSVGAVAACAGILVIRWIDIGSVPAIIVLTVIGLCYGMLQGLIIARLKIQSIVFTLGTLIALGGVSFLLSGEQVVTLSVAQLTISEDISTRLWIFSPASIILLVMFVLVGLLLGYTRIGREVYAVGGARPESRAAGVAEMRPIVMVFALSGMLAALAGVLASLRSGSSGPRAYDTLLFSAVAAVLIGGVSLYGGRGKVLGIAVGVLTLQFLLAALALKSAPFWAADLATGSVLLAFLVIELVEEQSPVRQVLARFMLARRQRRQPSPG